MLEKLKALKLIRKLKENKILTAVIFAIAAAVGTLVSDDPTQFLDAITTLLQ